MPLDDLTECRRLLFECRQAELLELATRAALRSRRDGDLRAWRRFTVQRGTALFGLGRFAEAVDACDEVIDSAPDFEDPGVAAQAWNASVPPAYRSGRPDALRRLDIAFAWGEWFQREQGRLDSLARAACTAGSLGMAELGMTVFASVFEDVDAGLAGDLLPGTYHWIRSQQISVGLWYGLALEHQGVPGAPAVFAATAELNQLVRPTLPTLPPRVAGIFAGLDALVLSALGRPDDGRGPLATVAAAVPRDGSTDFVAASLEMLWGAAILRATTGAGPPGTAALVSSTLRSAQRCGDPHIEAEVWRIGARTATAEGDTLRATVATERFDALVERLDWRRRLQTAEFLTVRSETFRTLLGASPTSGDHGVDVVGEDRSATSTP